MIKNILLVRGLSREKSHWGDFPLQLHKALGLKVHCIDLPGMGEFNDHLAPINIHENTLFLRQRWLELVEENPGEWLILGVSLGGMVCLDWATSFNSDAKNFIVVNSSVKGLCKLFDRMSPYALCKMSLAFLCKGSSQEKHIFELTSVQSAKSTSSRNIIKSWIDIRNKRPITRLNFSRQLLSAMRYQYVDKEIDNILFIAGKHDQLCSYRSSISLGKKYNAPVRLCDSGAGHDFALDRPDFLLAQIESILENEIQEIRSVHYMQTKTIN
jgi:pimeloyl-[acyl-carrier protein] methyl ester esterase